MFSRFSGGQRQVQRRLEALDTRYDKKRGKIAFSRLACLALAWKTRKIAPDVLQATPPKFNRNGGKGGNIAQCALFVTLKWHFESGKQTLPPWQWFHAVLCFLFLWIFGYIFHFILSKMVLVLQEVEDLRACQMRVELSTVLRRKRKTVQ